MRLFEAVLFVADEGAAGTYRAPVAVELDAISGRLSSLSCYLPEPSPAVEPASCGLGEGDDERVSPCILMSIILVLATESSGVEHYAPHFSVCSRRVRGLSVFHLASPRCWGMKGRSLLSDAFRSLHFMPLPPCLDSVRAFRRRRTRLVSCRRS